VKAKPRRKNQLEQISHQAASNSSVPCVYDESNFRYTRVWDPTALTKKMSSESLQSSVEPQRPAD
jgi:hypothetical protein